MWNAIVANIRLTFVRAAWFREQSTSARHAADSAYALFGEQPQVREVIVSLLYKAAGSVKQAAGITDAQDCR
jgi:hypothetical protein